MLSIKDMTGNWREIRENHSKIKQSGYPTVKIMEKDEFNPNTLKITSDKTEKMLIYIEKKSF